MQPEMKRRRAVAATARARVETLECDRCRLPTPVDLLDGKDDGSGNFTILECPRCYGRHWTPVYGAEPITQKDLDRMIPGELGTKAIHHGAACLALSKDRQFFLLLGRTSRRTLATGKTDLDVLNRHWLPFADRCDNVMLGDERDNPGWEPPARKEKTR